MSVVVSTYASEALIGGCLEMLLAQTIADDLEVIVVDSGSPQDEASIVRRFAADHPSIRYVRTERESLYRAWNRGLSSARGTYFANVNTDDWLRSDALELMAAALDEHRDCAMAYAHWASTDSPCRPPRDGDPVAVHPPFEPALPLAFCFGGCVQFWRTSSLRALGGFDAGYEACGDLEVLCRLASSGGNAVLVPEVLEGFFQNPEGISLRDDVSAREQRATSDAARALIDVARVYGIAPGDGDGLADAWTALGHFAMTVQVPWQASPLADVAWAMDCYHRALMLRPLHATALHNRDVALRQCGSAEHADALLAALPVELQRELRSWEPFSIAPPVAPVVRGPVFDVAGRGRLPSPQAGGRDSSRSQVVP